MFIQRYASCIRKKWHDEELLVDYAAEILRILYNKWGINLFVDGTPIDLGRNAKQLRDISVKSGVKIIASTGLYYFPSCCTFTNDESEIARWFLYECENGMEGTGIKPGILKCAAAGQSLSEDAKKRTAAAGIVQSRTGLPVYVHCGHQEMIVHEQINTLLEKGADPQKIIIGHVPIKHSLEYLESILKTGCYISVDHSGGYDEYRKENAAVLVALCKKGHGNRILLSNDHCIYSDFDIRGTTGLQRSTEEQIERFGYLFNALIPTFFAEGGTDQELNCMLHSNALDVLDV